MPFTNWATGDIITEAKLDNDNTYSVGTDTARTITVTHSWTASQTFTGGFTTGAAVTLGGNLLFTDATYDIGASGATRPRDLYLSRNATVPGTLTLTGATVAGTPTWSSAQAITLSTAAQPNVTSLGTLAANLLFVDATYDIGASGATRPRDLFMSRNLTVGGTAAITGAVTLSSTLAVTTSVQSPIIKSASAGNVDLILRAAGTGDVVFQTGEGGVVTTRGYIAGTGTFLYAYPVTLSSTLAVTGVATFTAAPVFSSGTASQTMELDGSKALTTVAITGTGSYVKSASPTLTGTIGAASMTLSGTLAVTGATTLSGALTYGGVALSNAVTGTGNMVLSASPTLTGTIAGAAMTLSSTLAVTGAATLSSTLAVTGTSSLTGNVRIGTGAVQTNAGLYLSSSATLSGVAQYGIRDEPVFTSAATSSGVGHYVLAATEAAAFTQTNTYGLFIDTPSKGGGSTITNLYGLWVANQTGGGTLNYAIKTNGGRVGLGSLPTSSAGLATGDLWNNAGVVNIV